MKVGIYYGSTIGDTAGIAETLGKQFNVEAISISKGLTDIENFDLILLGSSTWGFGDLQDEWEGEIDNLKNKNLSGKKIGLFGTGDQEAYEDTFCDALGIIGQAAKEAGGEIIGFTSKKTYNFSDSKALEGNNLIGLALDVNNQDEMTSSRVENWVEQLKKEMK